MDLKKIFNIDNLILLQVIGFFIFFFLAHNPYKSVMLYFSFIGFFAYWLIKIVFTTDLSQFKLKSLNKKV